MRAPSKPGQKRHRLWLGGLAGALTTLSLSGCADFWDKVTSHDFEMKNLWTQDNPLVVLRDSNNGDKRAWALRSLREPLQTGGTQKDQDFVMDLLSTAATRDRQPLCRLAAIEKLGQFKDPRAVKTLEAAFYNASNFPGPGSSTGLAATNTAGISLDMPTQIQVQALVALGNTGSPDALPLLTRVARQPKGEGPEEDQQQVLDVRLAAARALGKFKDPRASEALAAVYHEPKVDVALRERAAESYEVATGKKIMDLPAAAPRNDVQTAGATAPATKPRNALFGLRRPGDSTVQQAGGVPPAPGSQPAPPPQ